MVRCGRHWNGSWKNNFNAVSDSKSDKEEEKRRRKHFEQEVEDEPQMLLETTQNPTVEMEMKNLQTSFYEDANKIVELSKQEKAAKENLNFRTDLASIAMVAEDKVTIEEEPKIFGKSGNHPNKESQRKCREATRKEFAVWPNNKYDGRCPKVLCHQIKGVLNVSGSLKLNAIVSMWFSQVPWIYYSKYNLLVMNDIMPQVLLLIMIHLGLLAKVVNIKSVFLHRKLEEDSLVWKA